MQPEINEENWEKTIFSFTQKIVVPFIGTGTQSFHLCRMERKEGMGHLMKPEL